MPRSAASELGLHCLLVSLTRHKLVKGPHMYSDTPAGLQRLSGYFEHLYRDNTYGQFFGLLIKCSTWTIKI